MKNLTDVFGLTLEQTVILFSIQYQLVFSDINNTDDLDDKKKKSDWLKKWKRNIDNLLSKQQNVKVKTGKSIVTHKASLTKKIKKEIKEASINTPFYIILMESTLFYPYFPLEVEKTKSKLKYIKNIELLIKYADLMGIDQEYIDLFPQSFKSAVRRLSNYWGKMIIGGAAGAIIIAITAGLAAPAIGAIFASAGLYGAAAASAGLAALGGGAIAAGGAGVAGGIAVIVGGGAILGGTVGSTAARLFANPTFTMNQSAKLEVVMKEIVIFGQKDIRLAQEILKKQRVVISQLEDELIDLQMDKEKNKQRIKDIEKSISYLRKALKHNQDMI